MIVKGDQLPLAITLTNNGQNITPQQIKGMRIKLNDELYTYPEQISYNVSTGKWNLFLSQKQILQLGDIMDISVQVNFGGVPNLIKTTPTQRIVVDDSLFDDLWG